MENLIIIISMLLNITLIIALAVYMKRFNNAKKECKDQWFARLNNGVKIAHENKSVGSIEYISHDEQNETVKVLKVNENKIVDYYFDKINIL